MSQSAKPKLTPDLVDFPGKRSARHPLMTPGVRQRALASGRPELERFRNNLAQAMAAKNLSASDLARAIWGETTDARGYKVAKNRDRMTHYLAGLIHPSATALQRMAKILEIDVSALARDDSAIPVTPTPTSRDKDLPAPKPPGKSPVNISVIAPVDGTPMAVVTILCPVSLDTATAIAKLVSTDRGQS